MKLTIEQRVKDILSMPVKRSRALAQLLTLEELQALLDNGMKHDFIKAYNAKLKHEKFYDNTCKIASLLKDNTEVKMQQISGLCKRTIYKKKRIISKYGAQNCSDVKAMDKNMMAAYLSTGVNSDKIPRQKAIIHGAMKDRMPENTGLRWIDNRINDATRLKRRIKIREMISKPLSEVDPEKARRPFCYGVDNVI